jgi:hypothetical protein
MCSFSDEYTKILKSIEIKNNYTNEENKEIVKKIDDIDKVIKEEIFNYNKKIELLRDDREKLIILLSQLADKSSEIEKAFSDNTKGSNIIEYNEDTVKESNIIESQPVKPQKKSKSKKEVVDNVIENNKEINVIENNIIDEPVVEKIEEPKITKKSRSKK